MGEYMFLALLGLTVLKKLNTVQKKVFVLL